MVNQETLESRVGQKFGRLTIISLATPRQRSDGRHLNMVNCICECGKEVLTKLTLVTTGHTKSCGCYLSDWNKNSKTTHNLTNHPLFKIFGGMVDRCYNENNNHYDRYGGRGISICPEWLADRALFIKWALENGWAQGVEIDRRENDGNYSPANCRVVTGVVNQRNKGNNRMIAFNGKIKPLAEWCDVLHLSYHTTHSRLSNGWTSDMAFLKPPRCRLTAEEALLIGRSLFQKQYA